MWENLSRYRIWLLGPRSGVAQPQQLLCFCLLIAKAPVVDVKTATNSDKAASKSLGCNMGTGNSAVSQLQVPQVQVQFLNSGPKATPQPIPMVSWVFVMLQAHH